MSQLNTLDAMKTQFEFNSNKKMIVTFGAPGAGKTTLLNGLKEDHKDLRIVSETKKILNHDTLLGENLTKATTGAHEYYFLFQMAILPERFTKCFYAENYALVDESIFGTYAYSEALHDLGWISEKEYAVFLENFYRYLEFHPIPTKIIYLFCSTSTLKTRIKERIKTDPSRQIEKKYKTKYLDALNHNFKKTADFFSSKGFDFVFIDTDSKSKQDIKNEVKKALANEWTF